MVQESVQQGCDRRSVPQELPPVLDWAVGRQHGARPLVAPHDQFEQIFSGGVRQLAHSQVVDDKQRDLGHGGHVLLSCFRERRVGEFLDEDVGFAVSDRPSLEDCGVPDCLREVAFARSWWAKKEHVFSSANEAGSRQVEDHLPVKGLVEVEVKAIQRLCGVTEARLLDAPTYQTILSALEFVGH